MTKSLEKMTNAELVKFYNGFGSVKQLKAWKGKKSVLIEKIHAAEKQTGVTIAKPKAKPASSSKRKVGAIREFCEDMLQRTAYHERTDKPVGADNFLKKAGQNTRPVGYSFMDILNSVLHEFPEARTSYACLRWYGVHLRHAGVSLPRRPKSSWK